MSMLHVDGLDWCEGDIPQPALKHRLCHLRRIQCKYALMPDAVDRAHADEHLELMEDSRLSLARARGTIYFEHLTARPEPLRLTEKLIGLGCYLVTIFACGDN